MPSNIQVREVSYQQHFLFRCVSQNIQDMCSQLDMIFMCQSLRVNDQPILLASHQH